MTCISWEELLSKPYEDSIFSLDPYIPSEGVVLLWGDTSIGKSPVTWEMARCIGAGVPFMGLPTRKSKVLYIETDTAETVVQKRLKLAHGRPVMNVHFLFENVIRVPNPSPDQYEGLKEASESIKPTVVFINSLRKAHELDDKDSKSPAIVYGFYQDLFPKSALVFTHHEKKSSTNPLFQSRDNEGFSGSKHWLDDAQVGLHLERYKDKGAAVGGIKPTILRLFHRKSQLSAKFKPLHLELKDGYFLSCPQVTVMDSIIEMETNNPDMGKQDIDRAIGLQYGFSSETAKRYRLNIQNGLYPGTCKWLGESEGNDD